MRTLLCSAAAGLLIVSGTALAGGDGKCTHSTQECLDYMATQMKDSGWVGVELDLKNSEKYGPMKVTKIVEGSPAEEAGLRMGDVLVAVGGIQLVDGNQDKLSEARSKRKAGDLVTWSIERDDAALEVPIKLGSMPADILARYIGEHMLSHATGEVVAAK